MARISENSINSLTTDWGKDESNGLPYSGKAVQDFIKSQFINQQNETETKYGYSEFTDGVLVFYDKEGGTELTKIQFSGTNYIVDFGTAKNLTVLTSDESYYLPITPKSYSVELGSTNREEVVEDYTFKIEVDTGKGFVDQNVQDNAIKYGTTKHVDIRKMLVVGVNRVRVVVTGVESKQSKAIVYTTTLTSLTLECKHTWNTVWFEDKEYKITNIFFSGNVSKKLCVQIDDTIYETHFTANSEYKNVPYEFDVTGKLTSNESKIVPVKVWIESDNVKTKTYEFNVMFVSTSDPDKSLVCINEISNEVYNFEQETLFSYATYNLTELNISIDANLNGEIVNDIIPPRTLTNLQPQIKYKESLFLQINTEALDNLFINYTIYDTTGTIQLNNSHAYLAEPGAVFYMNPSLRSNKTSDKEQWYNSSDNSKINATWDKFTFADDAWLQDDLGNRALVVKAGSTVSVDYKPFTPTTGNSKTFEFMFKVSNIADYDTPILTVVNKETFDVNDASCVGLVLYPTRLLIMTDNERQELFQQLLLSENRIIHLAIVVQRNYASNSATNLVRIFVNGCENVTFAIQNSSKLFIDSAFNNLIIGQQSSDFYLYMMRQYNKALSGQQIINNYLNALIETFEVSRKGIKDDNAILDGGSISYDICKQVGYNTYVIETDKEIPSLDNPNTDNLRVNILLEYNDHPEWNVRINNTPIDGQGTTSSKYNKWNLRNKVDEEAIWIYPNLNNKTEKGKEGYVAGYGLNPKVSKITAKKNIASQPQGHKMGATSFYNDLFKKVLGDVYISENFPSSDVRVAVYQHPFMGFQKYSNGTYKFIGLYTIGPDKTDKKTFGYNEVEAYPDLMMIEGPNHDPLLTRFLTPWNEDVFYDNKQETLSVGDPNGEYQEGWDADIAGDFNTKKDNLLGLYEQEFKPAYDAVYFNSIYITSLKEANALNILNPDFNVTEFQKGFTNITLPDGTIKTFSNKLLSFYDSNYNLIYYRFKTGKYEVLSSHNLLQYLNLTGTPTTEQIIEARCNQWKEKVGKYVSIYEACYHHCFCELIGASDNDAKNTYWRKFRSLVNGGVWGFNQDDLDTIFQNDNNGQDTKKYFAEHNDVNANGGDIFQGRTSAFWTTLREVCKAEIQNTMHKIVEQALVLAEQFNLTASTKHETLFNLIKYYFWDHSAKYFPATAYNEDTQWGYIDVWYKDPSNLYNNVPPLTQIHGDHFETEYAWVQKRIAYIFSKYQIGAYEAQDGDGYGTLEFTCAEEYTLNVTPAIAQYPRVSYGGALTQPSYRTLENEIYSMTLQASGETALYIKGLDWISDLGDLSNLKLSSRGGSTEIPFSVVAKRIQALNLGGDSPKFNCTNLKIQSPSIEILNVKNVSTLNTVVDLSLCPRIREIDLSGTKIPQVVLPAEGRIEKLYLPSTINSLILNNLQLLNDLQIEGYGNISTLYCYSNNPIEILNNVLNTENNKLKSVGIIWDNTITVSDSSLITTLAKLTEQVDGKYKYSSAYIDDSGTLKTDDTFISPPNIQGSLYIDNYVYIRDIENITQHLKNVRVEYNPDKVYVTFEDPEFEKLIVKTSAEGGYGDGIGVKQEELDLVKEFGLNKFINNQDITDLSDLYKFRNLETIGRGAFGDCKNIKKVILPESITTMTAAYQFLNCSALTDVVLPKYLSGTISIIFPNTGITKLVLPNYLERVTNQTFTGNPIEKLYIGDSINYLEHLNWTNNLKDTYIKSLKNWLNITFTTNQSNPTNYGSKLYIGEINEITENKGIYGDILVDYDWDKLEQERVLVTTEMVNEALKEVTEIKAYAFRNMTQLEGELIIPSNIASIGNQAFCANSYITSLTINEGIETIKGDAFNLCTNLSGNLIIPDSLKIGSQIVFSECYYKSKQDKLFINLKNRPLLTTITNPNSRSFITSTGFKEIHTDDLQILVESEIPWFSRNTKNIAEMTWDLYVNNELIKDVVLNCPKNHTKLQNVFSGSSITSLKLNEGFTVINNMALDYCNLLSYVDLPSTLTKIGGMAFRGTKHLTMLCKAIIPPVLENITLLLIKVIYVPNESVDAYKSATEWSNFADRIYPISVYEQGGVENIITFNDVNAQQEFMVQILMVI